MRQKRREETVRTLDRYPAHFISLCNLCRQKPWTMGSSVLYPRVGSCVLVGQIAEKTIEIQNSPLPKPHVRILDSNFYAAGKLALDGNLVLGHRSSLL